MAENPNKADAPPILLLRFVNAIDVEVAPITDKGITAIDNDSTLHHIDACNKTPTKNKRAPIKCTPSA